MAVTTTSTPTESPIDLFQGWPSPELLPISLLQQATQNFLSDFEKCAPSLYYGPDPGPESLREALSDFLSRFYSAVWTKPDRLTITGGASQALACILQVFTDSSYTKKVYMVAPTYFLGCRIFEDNGFAGRLKAVPEDEEGINVDFLECCLAQDALQDEWPNKKLTKTCLPTQKFYRNVIYCVPTFSNPSGMVMTQRRREQLVRIARKYDALVVSDDVYDFLHWDPQYQHKAVMPRLVDIDQTLDGGPITEFGNVVSNGSFSKILGAGLRTGWTETTPRFAEGLSQCGSTRSGGSASHFTACFIADALRDGSIGTYISDVLISTYQRRHREGLDAIRRYLTPLGVSCGVLGPQKTVLHQGGYYIYIQLPHGINAAAIAAQAAKEQNLILGSGEHFEVKGDEESVPSKDTIRICIAWENEKRLVEGIRRLGLVLHDAVAGYE